jgi:hypothetical protein
MNDWVGSALWLLVLFSGLVAVPMAHRRRTENPRRFRAISLAAVMYLATQAWLYLWIFGSLRYENRDWLHALIFPFFLGLTLPVLMSILWFATRRRRDA